MPNVKIRIQTDKIDDANQMQDTTSTKKDKNQALISAFTHQAISTAKQIISYSASNIGNFTGNYLKQDEVNRNLEILGDVSGLVVGVATTVSTMNPIPMVASVIGLGLKYGTKAYSNYQEQLHASYQTNFLLARSGNSTTNGSRGTEN